MISDFAKANATCSTRPKKARISFRFFGTGKLTIALSLSCRTITRSGQLSLSLTPLVISCMGRVQCTPVSIKFDKLNYMSTSTHLLDTSVKPSEKGINLYRKRMIRVQYDTYAPSHILFSTPVSTEIELFSTRLTSFSTI